MPVETALHPASGGTEVSLEDLTTLLRNPGVVLVDVLPGESYESGHIPGAISLPLSDISERTIGSLSRAPAA